MDVRLYAADGVVGLDQASAGGLFEDVEGDFRGFRFLLMLDYLIS